MSFWTQHSELVIDSPSFNSIHPSVAGFFAVICISLFINPLLKAIRPKWALTQPEMLFIYAILIVTGPVVSIGGVHFFLPTLIAPYYYATPENEYAELFHRYIPSWFGPKDSEVIRQFYESSQGAGVPWEGDAASVSSAAAIRTGRYSTDVAKMIGITPDWLTFSGM